MISILKNSFSYIDLFRTHINLLYNSSRQRSTILGVIGSLIVYTFLIITFMNSDIFLKNSPKVVSQTLLSNLKNQIIFDDTKLMYFALADQSRTVYYDPSIFNIKFGISYFGANKNGTIESIYKKTEILKPCIINDTISNDERFLNFKDNSIFCVQNKFFSIESQANNLNYSIFKIELYSCDNLTSNNSCKSKEEINKFMAGKYFSAIIHHTQINVENYENPVQIINRMFMNLIDPSLSKRNYIYLKNTELYSNVGWFFDDITKFSDFKVDYQDFDINTRYNSSLPLYELIFLASYNYDKILRRYQNLPEFLGSFSGTAQFIIFFYFIISNFYSNFETMKTILNSLYLFQNIKKKKKTNIKLKLKNKSDKKEIKKINKKKNSKLISITDRNLKENINDKKINLKSERIKKNKKFSFDDSITLREMEIELNKKKILENKNEKKIECSNYIPPIKILQEDFFLDHFSANTIEEKSIKKKKVIIENNFLNKTKSQNLKLGICEYLGYIFSKIFFLKKKEKHKLIEKAENLYKENMDIIKILSKLQEIEKLKLIVMNDDQLLLFNHLSKPKIFTDVQRNKMENSRSSIMSQRISSYKVPSHPNDVFKIYEKLINSTKMDEISQRIVNLINDDFKTI